MTWLQIEFKIQIRLKPQCDRQTQHMRTFPCIPWNFGKTYNNCRNSKSMSIKYVANNSCFPQSHASDCGIVLSTRQSRWQPCSYFCVHLSVAILLFLCNFHHQIFMKAEKSANTLNKLHKKANIYYLKCVCVCARQFGCLFYEKCIWLSSKCKFDCCLSASEYCDFIVINAWNCKYIWE